MRSISVVVAAVLSVTLASAGPRNTVGGASFVTPKGWSIKADGAKDHMTFTKADKTHFCVLSVYNPHAAKGALDAEFATEWADILASAGAAPASKTRKVGTRTLREGGVQTKMQDAQVLASAHVFDAGGQTVTLITLATNATALAWCRGDLDALVKDIQVTATDAPAPPPASDTAPAKGVTVRLADLVGKWGNNGAATTSYVDSAGNYSGTSSTFFGEFYTIKADGSYTYSFQGRANNHTIRESGTGKIAFSGDLIVITGTRADTKFSKKYHLINYQAGKDGTAVLTLLDEAYPATAGNIGLYKEAWIKNPPQK
jgi:hypothetical protein